MPDRMPEKMSADMTDRKDMSEHMPDRMPEDMTDRMPEDLPGKKMYKCHGGDHSKQSNL